MEPLIRKIADLLVVCGVHAAQALARGASAAAERLATLHEHLSRPRLRVIAGRNDTEVRYRPGRAAVVRTVRPARVPVPFDVGPTGTRRITGAPAETVRPVRNRPIPIRTWDR